MSKLARGHQRLILGSLVALWVGVLPWLCWGGWSSPHHPHANPHFVFVAPRLHDDHASHDHGAQDHGAQDHGAQDHGAQEPLAGVARPEMLFIALLALVLPASQRLLVLQLYSFARHFTRPWSDVAFLLVPTPPPRACPTLL